MFTLSLVLSWVVNIQNKYVKGHIIGHHICRELIFRRSYQQKPSYSKVKIQQLHPSMPLCLVIWWNPTLFVIDSLFAEQPFVAKSTPSYCPFLLFDTMEQSSFFFLISFTKIQWVLAKLYTCSSLRCILS